LAIGVLRKIGRWITLRRQARIVALLLPARHWYRAAIHASRLHARLTATLGGGDRMLTEAVLLDNWLQELTFSGEYPIPWRAVEKEVLNRIDPGRGVLYCWTHLPLFDMALRAFIEMGYQTPLIVADPGRIFGDNELVVPGLAKRCRTIPVSPYVLTKLRTVLRRGGSVACLADPVLGGPISANILRLAGRVGARVVFFWAERRPDGVIDVYFIEAPRPYCESEEDIEVNMEFLRRENRRILDGIGGTAWNG
jgi:hypothetical protein